MKSTVKAGATHDAPISNTALWSGVCLCGIGGWRCGWKGHLQPLPSEPFHPDMYQTTAEQPKKEKRKEKQQEMSQEEKLNSPTMG